MKINYYRDGLNGFFFLLNLFALLSNLYSHNYWTALFSFIVTVVIGVIWIMTVRFDNKIAEAKKKYQKV